MQNMEDLRVRRTRNLLQKALVELTIEKGFEDVTVHDISERAMVNRSTFYRHYLDKYELLREYIEDVYALVQAQEKALPMDKQDPRPDKAPAWLVSVLRHVQSNADFYRVLLGGHGTPAFCAQSFHQYIEMQFRQMLSDEATPLDTNKPPIEMAVSYVSHAAMGAIAWWLEDEQRYTPEQLATWLSQFSLADISLSLPSMVKAT